MPGLNGRVALVTGAGRGIGKTITRVLAENGMLVGLNDLNESLVRSAVTELRDQGLKVLAVPGDVSRKADVVAMTEKVEVELGPLWLLVNNAGVLSSGPTPELSEESWDKVFAVDAKGVFLCSQEAIKRMMLRKKGRIVIWHPSPASWRVMSKSLTARRRRPLSTLPAAWPLRWRRTASL